VDIGILALDDFDFREKTVILRVDINSPIDHQTGQLIDDNRIRKSVPTIRELIDADARVVMLAHQGDTEDYHNLVSLLPHAERLSELLDRPVDFIDDIAGPAAIERIKALKPGELLLLNNVRYLIEEVSTFVKFVKLTPEQLGMARLVRNLAPLADYYVCEAFAAAHRYTPSLVGFAEVLPAAGGRLFMEELGVLSQVKENPARPCIYMLGGARIADAFSMMKQVLKEGTADQVLTSGLTGEVMLLARGYQLGEPTETLIHDRGLGPYIAEAKELIDRYEECILYPIDLAIIDGGRKEIALEDLPVQSLIVDIGEKTITTYIKVIRQAKTIFINGPPGVYEETASALGTEQLLIAVAEAPGYSVIGGGDSVAAAGRFKVRDQLSYVCTSGGGMVRFLSGQELPVVEALRRSARRYHEARAL
jgi:phosphoglycerate kinase